MISICAIFQDEAPFLKEWIDYHLLIGVNNFFLFNDRSTDNYEEVLSPYIQKGIVKLSDCFARHGERHFFNQRRAYARGLKEARDSRWVAVIDIDEFIVPKKTEHLLDMLEPYSSCLGIRLRWQKFGTNGHWEIPPHKLMIECLTKKSPEDDEDNWITKSIVQPKFLPESFFDEEHVMVNQIDLVHFCRWVVENGKAKNCGPFEGQSLLELSEAQLNHYWCRHEKYYREEKVKRKARLHFEDFHYPWQEEKIERYLRLYNTCEDHSIQKFVSMLRK